MIKVSNHVEVASNRKAAWQLISDFEGNWEASHPDHQEIMILSKYKHSIDDYFAWWQREKIGLVTGEYIAKMHDVSKQHSFSWSTVANYEYWRFRFKVKQGGTFYIEDAEGGITLHHNLWGQVEGKWTGWLVEWLAIYLLGQRRAISKHNLTELLYFKRRLEEENE